MKGGSTLHIVIVLVGFFFLSIIPVQSQTPAPGYTLTGLIMDISGEPVSGVSVGAEGVSGVPAVTDSNGIFSLDVPAGNLWLIINPVDRLHPKRVFLNKRREIVLYLTPMEIESMDDMVPLLMDLKERRNIISSYKSFDDEDYIYPYLTTDKQFQGSVPGMYVTNHSGMPGSATTSFIRGMKSLNSNNQPLYIIDGFPIETFGIFGSEIRGNNYSPLSSLEPFDIANITILKNDYATAIYGMRGSNGVILIETLNPSELATTIDFSANTGIQFKPDRLIPQMNNNQHRTYASEVLQSSDLQEENFEELYPALYFDENSTDYHRYKHNTNWQDLTFNPGKVYNAQLRIKGGDEIARYGLSVGYLNSEGVVRSTDLERINIRLVGTFNIFQWLRMYISTNLNTSTSNIMESALSAQTSPILNSLAKTPMMNPYLYDRDGNKLSVLDDVGSFGISNPYSIIENFKGINRNSHTVNSIRLEGDVSDVLKLNALFGINLNTLSEDVFMPNYGMAHYYDGTAYNVSKNVKNFLYSVYSDNSMTYAPKLVAGHAMKMTAGFRLNTNKYEQDIGISKNSHENDEYESLQHGVFYLNEIGGETAKWNRLAFYYNLSYVYNNRYLLNFAASAENSTRLGKNTELLKIGNVPFGTFYNFSSGWRISEEEFLKEASWLEELKVRLSYGVSGNDDIGNHNGFNYLQIDHYRETSAVIPGNKTNGSLVHENYNHFDAGIDLSLWANRMSVTADYYNITTQNLLMYEPQLFYSGFQFLPVNNGSVRNQGLELAFNYRVVEMNRFKWDLNVSVTPWQRNTVMEIPDDQQVLSFEGGEYIAKTGQSLLEFYGFRYEGVFSTTAEAQEAALVNEKGVPFIAGDVRYQDISGPEGIRDSVINEFDKVSLGSPMPDLYGGLNTTLTLGKWSLNVHFYAVLGKEIFNYVRYENEKMTGLSNQSASVLNRWVYEGQQTDVPRTLWNDPVGNSAFSSRWIEDGSFLKLKNLTLAYTIPDKFLTFRSMQLYITANNIFTLTNYLGYDPEFSYSFNPIHQGIDYGLIPITRNVLLGIKLGL